MLATDLFSKLLQKISRKKDTGNKTWHDEFVKIIQSRKGETETEVPEVSTVKFPCPDKGRCEEPTPKVIHPHYVTQQNTKVGNFDDAYSEIARDLKGKKPSVLKIDGRRSQIF